MKFAAGLFVLLSILSLPAGAQAMFTGEADNATRTDAANTSGRVLPPGQPMIAAAADSSPAEPVLIAPVAIATKKSEQPHRFLDRTNSLAFAAMAGSLTADALSTQRGLALPRFHEMNPLARPFVQTRTGAAFYTAGSFAFLSGGMYLAHKTNHHKLEKITPFVISGWEAFLATRNYHLVSKVVNSPK
jgi:hypothetical protein